MSWDDGQRKRLAMERQILAKYFPQLKWENPTTNTYVWGHLSTNAGNHYGVMLTLPPDYPASCPKAYVYDPNPLPSRGHSLSEASGYMHTLSPHPSGYVQVCHYRNESWLESCTLYKVALKVRFWLEAYEGHLATGNTIDQYLRHMPPAS